MLQSLKYLERNNFYAYFCVKKGFIMKGKRLLAVTVAALTTVGLTFAAAACSNEPQANQTAQTTEYKNTQSN